MTARNLLLALALATSASPASAQATEAHVIKTNGCGCCLAWMEHLEENGFSVTGENMFGGALVRYKLEQGVPQRMISCHTAEIDGYVVEGHVPAADIKRLLAERPAGVTGLAVAGMPMGSPGMEHGDHRQAYQVIAFGPEGRSVWANYEGK